MTPASGELLSSVEEFHGNEFVLGDVAVKFALRLDDIADALCVCVLFMLRVSFWKDAKRII